MLFSVFLVAPGALGAPVAASAADVAVAVSATDVASAADAADAASATDVASAAGATDAAGAADAADATDAAVAADAADAASAANATDATDATDAADAAVAASAADVAVAAVAADAPAGPDDLVADEAELAAWLDTHKSTGGEVRLSADISVAGTIAPSLSWSAPEDARLRIDTGEYGITVESGGRLALESGVIFTGDGAPGPVISVAAGGALDIPSTDISAMPAVSATGDSGVALSLHNGANFSARSGSAHAYWGASGANGIAIRADAPLSPDGPDAATLDAQIIEATGAGGKGIVSAVPVRLYLCRVTADAASVEAPQIMLDNCAVSPDAPGAAVVRRTAALTDSAQRQISAIAAGDRETLDALASNHDHHFKWWFARTL